MTTRRRGHPRTPGNTYRDGSCKRCRQINRQNQLLGIREEKSGTRDRPIMRPEVQPDVALARAIANESWTPKPPWERPGWRPAD